MNKKGQSEIVGIIVLAGLLLISGISSHKILSENRYVGDETTNVYYDLSRCVIEISPEDLVSFNTQEEAIQNGFTSAPCNNG